MLNVSSSPECPTTLPPKSCACGLTHDATAWAALEFVGFMDDGEGGQLELRNCDCNSTIAIEVPPCS